MSPRGDTGQIRPPVDGHGSPALVTYLSTVKPKRPSRATKVQLPSGGPDPDPNRTEKVESFVPSGRFPVEAGEDSDWLVRFSVRTSFLREKNIVSLRLSKPDGSILDLSALESDLRNPPEALKDTVRFDDFVVHIQIRK